jgi:hypothetical protein
MELVISLLMVVFVKVHGLCSKPSILSQYLQIQISMSHTFGNLLYLLLDKHKASGSLATKLDILEILGLDFKVQH